ncbi:excinuclease ABC subunit UvrA [Rubritalea marina]|uniref:excinuclease ABC subunit UvrA n=1 Tax=Rubritalea marina TaxID=361055 RepID=UPI00037E8BDB|nr:excinuclease ABC subunit UvrA [Rubritalea marina]
MEKTSINIQGARQHNLKNLDLKIPSNQLTVITGPSGSGKSSLAFHTLYAEGQRRYVETFSPYVRQFLDRMDKPVVDHIDNIPPAIAIEQKNSIRTTRSTVGSLTELNDFLKTLYPLLASAYDPETGEQIQPDTVESISRWVLEHCEGENILVLFPIQISEQATSAEVTSFLNQQGYLRLLRDGAVMRTDDAPDDGAWGATSATIIQDRIKVTASNQKRLSEALEAALHLGKGHCSVQHHQGQIKEFSNKWDNPETGFSLPAPSSSLFSFNSPLGACPECRGFGRVIGIDLHKAIQDPTLTIREGVIKPFESERGAECKSDLITAAHERSVSLDTPWHLMPQKDRDWVLQGEKGNADKLWKQGKWYGVRGFFDWMESKAYKMHVRVFLSRYRAYTTCQSCNGTRLKPEASCFKINDKSLPDLWQLTLGELKEWFDELKTSHSSLHTSHLLEQSNSLKHALSEITSRLGYLCDVGLSYLTLDRPARTLSGGEIERVNLTTCLGAALTNTLFVLDEPTVGLHARDIHRLVKIMHQLRDKGNTVVVVEHEEAVMKHADHLIDMGPEAGEHGGNISYQGPIPATQTAAEETLKQNPESCTLPYLTGSSKIQQPKKRRKAKRHLIIKGAHQHNISNQDIKIPIGSFTCLTGVSGSGKSTMANEVIYRNLLKTFLIPQDEDPAFIKSITGADYISGVERVDQSPLAKTPRSTPAVYAGAFDAIRELFALSEDAYAAGKKAGYFSFNSGEGRCNRCWGNGFEKVEMQFLSDLFITCPECDGKRYHNAALNYKLRGKSIADVLNFTINEAIAFFKPADDAPKGKEKNLCNKVLTTLQPLVHVGLGYLRLGQPLNTLSGGESQRIKLCSLLSKTGKVEAQGKLLILDEPTTGLHFRDIERLLGVFQSLVNAGHSLLVIEHNLDVIRNADHLIEMGPQAGSEGGQVTFAGTPEQILKSDTETAKALLAEEDAIGLNQTSLKVAEDEESYKVAPTHSNNIVISGAREHNLKDIDLSIPRDSMVVLTGLSGSGKSTLAFDIIFAEGQRRFLDSMSPYARQFAGQLEKPEIDKIEGLPPTVAIEQRVSRGGGKSTVGTVTEIFHFLRLLYAKLGTQYCPDSGEPVVSQTSDAILEQLKESHKPKQRRLLLAPLIRGRKGFHTDVAEAAGRKGIEQLLVDGTLTATADFQALARYKEHDIFAVISDGVLPDDEQLDQALRLGKGQCGTAVEGAAGDWALETYSTARVSPVTGRSFPELDPHHFSFNSARGWCPSCRGFGMIATSAPKKRKKKRGKDNEFNSAAEAEIAEEIQHSANDEDSEMQVCPDCQGDRINRDARFVFLHDHNIAHVSKLPVTEAAELLSGWKFEGRDGIIARDILPEIVQRLHFLEQVGLNYLSLDRSADTLSGGESQRIRLAAQLGSNLTGVLYVLDEPTIGLHPRDNVKLLDTLETLRSRGNSLLIVEHDEETIERADQLIDLGPGAGVNGGTIVANLPGAESTQTSATNSFPESPTLEAIASPLQHPLRGKRRALPKVGDKDAWLKLSKCSYNNLKDIDVRIPIGRFTTITGVSGCGKSSLMRGTLPHAFELANAKKKQLNSDTFAKSQNFDTLKHCFEVDQSPIGKTSRSCPATYVKIFDTIRQLFAQVPEARMRGYTASRFSFNNNEGQCPECKGNGRIKLEMDFLPTTWVPCTSCDQMRYNRATLEILYQGKTIGEVLQMNISTAAEFFKNHPKLQRTLSLLADTGLGYLQLGQASPTLSGGEAQRLKLVAELTKGRKSVTAVKPQHNNLYLIEEPTIGLHQTDIVKLIDVLHRLVDEGHTVVVIEHHTAIMAEADYIIDMGPEAGDQGGTIVAQGKPEQIAKYKKSQTAPFIAGALTGK